MVKNGFIPGLFFISECICFDFLEGNIMATKKNHRSIFSISAREQNGTWRIGRKITES